MRRIKKYAKKMRLNATESEDKTTRILRKLGIVFRRQVVLGPYIADFVGSTRPFVLEIDGSSHVGKEVYDARRDEFLKLCGFEVYHIENENVSKTTLRFLKQMEEYPANHIRNLIWYANRPDVRRMHFNETLASQSRKQGAGDPPQKLVSDQGNI